jgi:hypothetical protein
MAAANDAQAMNPSMTQLLAWAMHERYNKRPRPLSAGRGDMRPAATVLNGWQIYECRPNLD